MSLAVLLAVGLPGHAAAMPTQSGRAEPALAVEGSTPAIELREALGRLLGEHAFLLMEAMRVEGGTPDRDALRAAVDDNSADLTDAVASVYGDGAGQRFGELWDRHVVLLIDYADAVRADDGAAQRSAEDGLNDYTAELGRVLAELNPELNAGAEEEALRSHIDQLAAFAEGDFDSAYAAHRTAFHHMFELGDHLGLGIVRQFPDRFSGGVVAFSPRSDLRLALDRLLGEHMVLAAQAMRAGVKQAPDFEAASASLAQNTADLSGAIGDIYGDDAGVAFDNMWSEHTDAYLGFVQALGAGDDTQQGSALSALHAYHDRIAALLTQVNPLLDGEAVADLIRRHVQALITQAEATAADDPARAVAATREGYAGTFEVGAALADAIARQFPDDFRDLRELPSTDAARPADPPVPASVVFAVILLALTCLMVILGDGPSSRRVPPSAGSR